MERESKEAAKRLEEAGEKAHDLEDEIAELTDRRDEI